MLIQAGNIYTPKIFEVFQEDYEEYLGAYIKDQKEDNLMKIYIVANINESKERIVSSNPLEQTVYCECRKFETHGILCSHALKVLDLMNIKLLPDHYILKRWTKDARRGHKDDWIGKHKEVDDKSHFTNRYRELCPRIGNLIYRASESYKTYTFMSKVCEEATKIVEQMLAERSSAIQEAIKTCHLSISMTSEDHEENGDAPSYNVIKGIKKRQCSRKGRPRLKSRVEKKNRKINTSLKQKGKQLPEAKTNETNKAKCTTKPLSNTKRNQLEQRTSSTTSPTDYYRFEASKNLTFTQLLHEPLHNSSNMLCVDTFMASEPYQEN